MPGLPLTQFRVVSTFQWKILETSGTSEKAFLFSCLENSGRKFVFHVFKPFLNISFRLSRPFFIKRNWLRQTGNAITERNQTLSVLNQFSSLFAQTDRFTRVNSRKALCPKACDTASSHCYLPLGTFRQRAVRGGCIAEYALYQEPITWSLHLPYKPLESTLSDEKLFIEIAFAEYFSRLL